MAPAVSVQLTQRARVFLSERFPSPSDVAGTAFSSFGSLAAGSVLKARDEGDDNGGPPQRLDTHAGVVDAHDINNVAVFVVFGLIGAAFVCVGIWFFFWANNGGFYFKEDDWDDYKSTVLRRKGPNGTVLSGATRTTDLGGGSIYKDFDDAKTTVTDSTGLSGITAGASDIAAREKREKKRRRREREREREREASRKEKRQSASGGGGRRVDETGQLIDEEAEREAKKHLRSYRHEKPARVGGLNKESEASEWDGSTNPAESTVVSSLLSHREETPTSTPTKKPAGGGIRKVYSTADRTASRENERIRAEARRLQERGRAARANPPRASSSRRDFSFQRGHSTISESDVGLERGNRIEAPSTVPSSGCDESDLGTRSYHHRLLEEEASAVGSEYAEEKRRNRRHRRNRD
ncbi:hypothetical protein SODALDRAFT_328899 [Sodiomyces alkalinus F11]|uniref:Endosomal SPRY domain-containing protein n=1 Tax=Sodiomyces alkalinus (strain CBS 110278 / VKM F-3762 / F11) TaxID=1314773 RepID=A0A3N2PLY5_SODAK|nr:hypothetical protein SODALDRAFT_328899 [Sodiomyces alkalinus F11]ROT35532.1 hypothetical protein SODALDRAFT_328899 [Sodiomyces alkalinus F11]